jgi:hypothetical protein
MRYKNLGSQKEAEPAQKNPKKNKKPRHDQELINKLPK